MSTVIEEGRGQSVIGGADGSGDGGNVDLLAENRRLRREARTVKIRLSRATATIRRNRLRIQQLKEVENHLHQIVSGRLFRYTRLPRRIWHKLRRT